MAKRRKSKSAKPTVAAVSTHALEKTYGEVTALAEIDLEVPQGEAVVLVGHNGSGKSTLLGLLAGTMEPTDGSVEISGSAPDSTKARMRRSWLPDNPVLYDDLTVKEHLEYVSRLHGGACDEELLDTLIERLGLYERRDNLPSQFSRGLRQKTAIAVAMCRPFSLLLVDEPFVGLDGHGVVAETIHRFKGLEADVVIVVLTESNPDNLLPLAYVGLSRARAMLVVVGRSRLKKKLRWSG